MVSVARDATLHRHIDNNCIKRGLNHPLYITHLLTLVSCVKFPKGEMTDREPWNCSFLSRNHFQLKPIAVNFCIQLKLFLLIFSVLSHSELLLLSFLINCYCCCTFLFLFCVYLRADCVLISSLCGIQP